jgi:predicted acetyltransferase
MEGLRLVEPSETYRQAFMELLAAYQEDQTESYQGKYDDPDFDFDAYIARLARFACGDGLPEGYVPCSTFWLTDDTGILYGSGRLRHYLTDDLMLEGGNIGYDIHPAYRRRGYGTELLRLLLKEAAKLGVARALVTCDEDNAGSRRIIEKNGGVYDGKAISPESGKLVLRFWVPTGP